MSLITVSASGDGVASSDLFSYLGISKREMAPSQMKTLMDIMGVLSFHRVDGETAVAILKSFEMKMKAPEDFGRRIANFKTFLDTIDHRDNLIDSVKNLGMLSKSELEAQAQENGDWLSVIKRNEKDDQHRRAAHMAEVAEEAMEVEKKSALPIIEETIPSLSAPTMPSASKELSATLAKRTELLESLIGK